MSTGTLATTDHDIQQAVQDELLWSPEIDDARIGVAVQDRVVTLSGEIDDHPERIAAEHAALRTAGVTTVVDDLVIHHASYVWAVSETDIAARVERVIAALAHFPDSVRATVENHTVTLSGEVEWNYQRESVRRSVEHIKGVAFVVNEVTLVPRASVAETAENIRKALVRNATLDANRLEVAVAGTIVTLTGKVRSYVERKQAEAAAWASPHVTEVHNDVRITL